jgi:CubicO group peptidase (beta-lactamase class C family)
VNLWHASAVLSNVRSLLPILFALLILVPGCLHAAPAEDRGLLELDRRLAALKTEHKLPGLAVVVVRDGKIVWERAYGYAYLDDEVKMTTDTPMWIASVTKPLVAALFVRLEAQKKISLDDRINDVPEWTELCEWLGGSGISYGKNLRCAAPITIRDILQHRVNGTPGVQFLYNPIVFSRLSRYLEHKFGGSVRDVEGRQNRMARLMEQEVLGPAKMRRTMSSQWQGEKVGVFFDMALGYGVEDGDWVTRVRPERHLAGGAGVVGTVLDLARFDIALDRGLIVRDPERLFTPPRRPEGTPSPYAYGWYVQHLDGERLVWHSGWDPEAGFSALYVKLPDRDLTFIALANGEGLWWGNPPDGAAIEGSPFARAFLETVAAVGR